MEDDFYRRQRKRSYWPLLRGAVFLGGFERRRKIARLGDGDGKAGGDPTGGRPAGGGVGKAKQKKDQKDKKKKKNKDDEDGDGGSGEDDEEHPLPPGALSVALNHLNLPLATSRLWEMGACLTSVDLRHNRIERVHRARTSSAALPSQRDLAALYVSLCGNENAYFF